MRTDFSVCWLAAIQICFLLHVQLSAAFQHESKTDGKWYKGNLHTHSLWSDGNDFPDMIVSWYRERDYANRRCSLLVAAAPLFVVQ